MIRRLLTFIFSLTLLSTFLIPQKGAAFSFENIQLFGTDLPGLEQNNNRKIADCFKYLRDFLSAGVGVQDSQDFTDYWRDFFLWPAHYSDVAVLDQQINQTRYGVMSAFLKCEVERQKPLIDKFYKLEAERYYVRHYVDTSGGYLKVLTTSPSSRREFAQQLIDYFVIRKEDSSDTTRFSAYFDAFEMKYRDRPELYASYENDPVFKQLADKVKELQDTLKGFQEFGDQMTMLFDEAIVQPAQAVGTFAKDFYNNPGAGIRKIGSAIASKFDACVSLEDDRYCVSGDGNGNDFENPFNDFIDNFTVNRDRKSFQQVMVSISQQNTARSEDLSAAEMMSRYEVLYGQSGAGTKNVIEHLDKLIQIVDTDSLSALNEAQVCAANVRGRQCK